MIIMIINQSLLDGEIIHQIVIMILIPIGITRQIITINIGIIMIIIKEIIKIKSRRIDGLQNWRMIMMALKILNMRKMKETLLIFQKKKDSEDIQLKMKIND
jgi:hypothetical protein